MRTIQFKQKPKSIPKKRNNYCHFKSFFFFRNLIQSIQTKKRDIETRFFIVILLPLFFFLNEEKN